MAHRILNPFRLHSIGFALLACTVGCGKLSEGVVREIQFPEHDPELAVTFLARPQADSLVARTHSSAGILDTVGSKRVKEAVYTLIHESGTSVTWGGQQDWVSGRGHVLTDVDLALGTWTLTVEAPGFEAAIAEQTFPPVIDSIGEYAYSAEWTLVDSVLEVEPGWAWGNRQYELSLSLPDRPGVDDHFLLRPQWGSKWHGEGGWETGNHVYLDAAIEDDPRLTYNESLRGYLIQDVPGAQALEAIPFEVFQEAWGDDPVALFEEPAIHELVALTPEMALFYRRLDQVENPSGGPFFSEPILAYSNVSSGYGCFGLYTSTEITME